MKESCGNYVFVLIMFVIVFREFLLFGIFWKKCNIKDLEFIIVFFIDFILIVCLIGVEKCLGI